MGQHAEFARWRGEFELVPCSICAGFERLPGWLFLALYALVNFGFASFLIALPSRSNGNCAPSALR